MSKHNAAYCLPLDDRPPMYQADDAEALPLAGHDDAALRESHNPEEKSSAGERAPRAPKDTIKDFAADTSRIGDALDEASAALGELRLASRADWPTTVSASHRLSVALGLINLGTVALRLRRNVRDARDAALKQED